MTNDIVLGAALRNTISSISRTQRVVDSTTLRLATGKKVNSALDQPQNFFTAQALGHRASDLNRLLDGIGQSIFTVREALTGVEAVEKLLNQGDAVASNIRDILTSGGTVSNNQVVTINTSPQPISTQIQALNPDIYYRLNEAGGPIIDSGFAGNAATLNGGASLGAPALYTNGAATSAVFDGINDRIRVSDSALINTATTPARTVELVFNADTTAGRQVLYEEGATVNGLTIYIDAGLIRVTAEDDQGGNRFADLDISAPIIAGQTYHVAFVFDGAAQTFAGFLDGVDIGTLAITSDAVFPSHSGDVGIGGVNGGVQFHDGESGVGNGFNFDGRISDVAIYNQALTSSQLLSHARALNSTTSTEIINEDFEEVINQINLLVLDASYRGINLLADDNLITNFNEDRSNFLITEGVDFSAEGLGLENHDFDDLNDVEIILSKVRNAIDIVRNYGSKLSTDLSIIDNRQTFVRNTINTLTSGADDLTVADLNEEGANLLAVQTRQALGFTALSLAAQSQASILEITG
ncbi:MAG: hypothetical protein DHS20C02_01330 [Micavibrio sp.]|nr:MAG: hypothetical protein DHS20C02_01330 [Micavibrio sp.]